MPFENESKVEFKDLSVCDQQEVIDTLSGKYSDREVYAGDLFYRKKENESILHLDGVYKVVQKNIIISIREDGCYTSGIPFKPGKYKLVKVED